MSNANHEANITEETKATGDEFKSKVGTLVRNEFLLSEK